MSEKESIQYINLRTYNASDKHILLDFTNMGAMTIPINSKYVMVYHYDFPNSSTPIMNFNENTYLFKLSYSTYSVQAYATYIDRGNSLGNGEQSIWEILHLMDIYNKTISSLVTALDSAVYAGTSSHLPSLVVPYFYFDPSTQLLSYVSTTSAYNSSLTTPIILSCNQAVMYQFASIDVSYNSSTNLFNFLVIPSNERTYMTTLTKMTQQSISVSSICDVQKILITTSLPVANEVFTQVNAGQSNINVLQSFTYSFANGLMDFLSPNIYDAKTMKHKKIKCECNNLYQLSATCYYQTSEQHLHPFFLPPHKDATITLAFFN